MARPKGVIQKRDEKRYTLPEGVTLLPNQGDNYRKDTFLTFLDDRFGEFTSTFKAIQGAKASTHPKAVSERREATCLEKYGNKNPGGGKEIREKAQATMLEKYGVRHALESKEFLDKSRETCFKNHGVYSPTQNEEIYQKQRKTNLERYGHENPMGNKDVQEKNTRASLRNGTAIESKGEKEVRDFVESLGLTTKKGYFRQGDKNLQLDMVINELPIAIEYNGNYWHSEACSRITPTYHLNKTNFAKENGLRLLHIFEFEWKDRNSQVKSFLRSALGKNEIIVYARKTEIREVSKNEARDFLNQYHILGACGFNKALGLYQDNELLCMITIGKHHRNGVEWVLSRFVGKENYNVVGGLSKLTKAAKDEFGELTTWIDLRWSDGSNWLKSGWELIHKLRPDYFYFDNKTGDIISKQSRRKSVVNTPEGVTEHEHATKERLYRIHDCGKLKLRF